MKRVIVILTMAFFIPLFSIYAEYEFKKEYDIEMEKYNAAKKPPIIDASKIDYEKTPLNKLGRGMANMMTFWAEIPAGFFRATSETDPVAGTTIGVPQGIVMAFFRGITAAYDVATFAIPPYDQPLMKPDYALKHADETAKEVMRADSTR